MQAACHSDPSPTSTPVLSFPGLQASFHPPPLFLLLTSPHTTSPYTLTHSLSPPHTSPHILTTDMTSSAYQLTPPQTVSYRMPLCAQPDAPLPTPPHSFMVQVHTSPHLLTSFCLTVPQGFFFFTLVHTSPHHLTPPHNTSHIFRLTHTSPHIFTPHTTSHIFTAVHTSPHLLITFHTSSHHFIPPHNISHLFTSPHTSPHHFISLHTSCYPFTPHPTSHLQTLLRPSLPTSYILSRLPTSHLITFLYLPHSSCHLIPPLSSPYSLASPPPTFTVWL